MIRRLLLSALLAVLGPAAAVRAHFLFVVPEPGGAKARVMLSEDLTPDEDVSIEILAPTKLVVRPVGGTDAKPVPVPLAHKDGSTYLVDLPGTGLRVVAGEIDIGVRGKPGGPGYLAKYYAKTVVGGDPFDPKAVLGDAAAVEIVPVGGPGKLQFKVLAKNAPVAAAEVNVIAPDGKRSKTTTDKDGLTPPLEAKGRYGAWARNVEPTPGEADGKKYTEIRRYAMLVVDAGDTKPAADAKPAEKAAEAKPAADAKPAAANLPAAKGAEVAPAPNLPAAEKFATMPQAASSFGAVAADGWLYVYGGHVARVHTYSTEAVSGRFHRLNLADGKTWEELPGGPGLQGMNLAAHGGKVYRVGGMQPRNKPGDKADMYSVADVAVYDPAAKAWSTLPPLPEPRSSHDVIVVNDTLVVVGGWNQKGRGNDEDWAQTVLTLDLKAAKPEWKTHKQPFQRRALIAGVHQGKVYVLGGLTEDAGVVREVAVYDLAADAWSAGPNIPGTGGHLSFSPAAASLGGRFYLSVADGTLLRLTADAKAWEPVAKASPRIVHRMVAHGPTKLLVVGGALKMENLDSIEAMTVPAVEAAAAK